MPNMPLEALWTRFKPATECKVYQLPPDPRWIGEMTDKLTVSSVPRLTPAHNLPLVMTPYNPILKDTPNQIAQYSLGKGGLVGISS